MSISGPLPEHILNKMNPEDRPKNAGGLTMTEVITKESVRREREEQRTFATWLDTQEYQGKLCFDWSATHKKVTNRVGMPDFRIMQNNRILLIEMKGPKGQLSPEQKKMKELLMASGNDVYVMRSAGEAIKYVKLWLES